MEGGVIGIMTTNELEERKKQRILSIAMETAITWAATIFAVTGMGVAAASTMHPRFKKAQISIKIAIPVMSSLFAFSLKYEHTTFKLKREPHLMGDLTISNDHDANRTLPHNYSMPMSHKLGNFLYDHPFMMVLGFGLPFAGYILRRQQGYKHLTTSQKVMHSRVIAQGGILTFALSTMAFRGYMDKRGRFPDPEDISRKQSLQKQ